MTPGRNDPCPCGSGKKYKTCCGRLPDSARPAVRNLPQDAVAQFNLGNSLARAGRLEEALTSFERALMIRADFAEARQNLGETLRRLGRFDQALVSCRRALELKADFAEAHNTLANVLLKLNRLDDALASFRRALAISPDFAEAHVNMANAVRGAGRLDEAVAGYRRALQIDANFIAAHIELGTALRLQGRIAESEGSCLSALEINPHSAAALAVLAELRADCGRFAEAEEFFRRVIALEPDAAEAWAGIARLRRMTPADEPWLAAVQRLAGQGLPARREMTLRYAMGKYFDDLQDFERAFRNYQRANELDKGSGPGYDRVQWTRTVDLIIRSHGRRWLGRRRARANPSARPVFIVGMLRSGTTLAEQILASHPAVHGAGELTFWGAKSAAAISLAAAADGLEVDLSDDRLAELGDEYLSLLQEHSADALRVVNKFPTNFPLLGMIHAALPQARIIHMRRNPVDTCLSIYFQHFEAANTQTNDLHDLAHYYREYARLMQHWRTVLPAGAMLEVPYEGLVAEQEMWSRKMLEFIALPWDPRCLEFHRTARTVITASRWQVRQKIHTSSVERWRHYEEFVRPLQALLEADSLNRP